MFVIEYCLAQLLMSWGVRPQAVIGYSLGEFVAATVAGSLELEDALRLVALRARLIDSLPAGAMLAVPLSEAELAPLLNEHLSIAIRNTPRMTVVSGIPAAIEELELRLSQREILTRRLQTTHAFHSVMMQDAREGLRELLETVELTAPRIPYISNLTGTWIDEQAITSPEYWLEQMCRTVRFADGIGELLKEKERVLIEVGAGQSLGSFVKQHPDYDSESSPAVVPVLRAVFHEQSDEEYLQAAVARLWLAGIEPDWSAFYATQRRLKVPLPTYAFERQRYWIDAAVEDGIACAAAAHAVGQVEAGRCLLCAVVDAGEELSVEPIHLSVPPAPVG